MHHVCVRLKKTVSRRMKLVIMTKSTFFVEEDKIIISLFEEGLENLHLYKPNSSPLYAERLLSLLPEEFDKRITVHEHFYLKSEYNLAGIHLDRCDMPLPEGYKGKFSRSCTNIEMLKEAKKKARYVFLKNIFDCIEFKDEKSNLSIRELEDASRRGLIDKHVYALGGMSIDKVKLAKDLGFGGVVVCGDLWNRFDIHNETDFRNLMSHFEKLRKAVG